MSKEYVRRHLSTNIAGLLRKKNISGELVDSDGKELSDYEAREYLEECLSKGWRVIPCGDCDNFDYQTGCKGHKSTREKYEYSRAE